VKSGLRRWRRAVQGMRMRAPTADAEFLLVLVSPYRSSAWELWPEPRTVATSTRYSIVCYAELPRAATLLT
jgi:hypothetical protein